ncbi:MAG: hypothetical protein KME06_10385 [Kastovskya adunca ATA6-11-RM4]|jgi:gas vesicle protein|nr:hypothetical protein [Kastovskya adunca ATA6-11-RM4]
MSQREGFSSGFLAGAIVGSLVGGAIGALIASGRGNDDTETGEEPLLKKQRRSEAKALRGKRRQLNAEESIEVARRSLEDKIAQLNSTIDEVRTQLGTVNGNVAEIESEQSPRQEL